MNIAVVNECSTLVRNPAVVRALEGRGHQVYNLGVSEEGHGLLYAHTGLITAMLLDSGTIDFVVGGCGTGQGYLMAANQFAGVFCGHIRSGLDAWLFARINAGNAISLALQQGYGWASDVELGFIFDRLFSSEFGGGYPVERKEPQKQGRDFLSQLSQAVKRPLMEVLPRLPKEVSGPVLTHEPLRRFWREHPPKDSKLASFLATAGEEVR